MRIGTTGIGIGVTLAMAGCVASLWGCSESSDACVRRSDCPPGQTCSDGRCLPELKGDSSPAPDSPGVDTLPDAVVWPDTGPVDGGCTANHNGMIERQELVLVVPTTLMYVMGTQLPLNLKGATSGGKTVWDFTAAASDDHDEPMKLEPVPTWAAASFPSATYVSLADKDADTYGVYLVNQTRMQLLGAISGVKDHGKVSYSTPVDLLRFPVQPTDSYSTKTFGTGFWGIAVISNWETWDAEVVGAGVVQLPKLSLDSVMVRIRSQQYLYGNPFLLTTTTLFLFISECYGTVARVVVDGDPPNLAQVTARERWRITTP